MTIRCDDGAGECVDLDHWLRDELQAMLETQGRPVALGMPAAAPTEVPMTAIARRTWTQLAGLCAGARSVPALS